MHLKKVLCFIGLLLVFSACDGVSLHAVAAPPNIVVFLSDDHGQLDSTPYGATDVRTPNMQRLAEAGMVMTHAFVASPACAPSRSAMLTGLMPARNGAEANHTFKRDDVRSLVEDLKSQGYEVAAFGKVAHGKGANRYGFDHIDAKYGLATVTEFLVNRDASRALCLFVGTHEPHVPWPESVGYDPAKVTLPPTFFDSPETRAIRAQYYTDITIADRELGETYDLIRKQFDATKTLFIYTSDHGGQWPFGKWNLYDAGIRVPFIAVWPGVIKPGRSDAMIQWIDLLPTLIDVGGGVPPKDIDGRSFAAVLRGAQTTHRDEIFTTHNNDGRMNVYPIRSVRTRDFKYMQNLHPDWAHTTHIDQGGGSGDGWRYFDEWVEIAKSNPVASEVVKRYHERPREELFDLRVDPFELHNLANDPTHAQTRSRLSKQLELWCASQNDSKSVAVEPRLLSDPSSWKNTPARTSK